MKSSLYLHLFLTVPVEQEDDFPVEKDEAQTHDQSPFDEEETSHITYDTGQQSPQKEDVPAEQYYTAEEAISTEEPYAAASEEAADESCIIASNGVALPDYASPSEAVYEEDHPNKKITDPDTMWKAPQVAQITKRFHDSEQHLWTNKKPQEPK